MDGPGFRAVVFDLDGTIADTLATIGGITNYALQSLHLPEHPLADYRKFVGDGVVILCRRALPVDRTNDDALHQQLLARVRARYATHYLDRARLYPGIEPALVELERRGARLAIFSNKPDELTQKTMEGLGVGRLFDFMLGQRSGIAPKPDPAGARVILEQLGVRPDQVLCVGDSAIDMETARNAGFAPLGVLWGFRDRKELLESGARWLVSKPEEIVQIYAGQKAG